MLYDLNFIIMKRLVLLFLFFTIVGFAQKPIFTTAKIKSATVYFNAAELSQTASVNLPIGTSEIVIKNVADYLNESTVQIGAPSSVTVLSVQFTQNYISEYEIDETNPAIKKVRDSISWTEKEIKKILVEEIVSRYYFQEGMIEASLQGDPVIDLAKQYFASPARMVKVLSGPSK